MSSSVTRLSRTQLVFRISALWGVAWAVLGLVIAIGVTVVISRLGSLEFMLFVLFAGMSGLCSGLWWSLVATDPRVSLRSPRRAAAVGSVAGALGWLTVLVPTGFQDVPLYGVLIAVPAGLIGAVSAVIYHRVVVPVELETPAGPAIIPVTAPQFAPAALRPGDAPGPAPTPDPERSPPAPADG